MNQRTNRWRMAIGLGVAVAAVQLAAFVAIGFFAWRDLRFGSKSPILAPMPFCGRIIDNQFVFPVGEFIWFKNQLGISNINGIRSVNLATGSIRDFPTPGMRMSFDHNMVWDGKNLWYFPSDRVIRFDGAEVTTTFAKNAPPSFAHMSDLFLYEGKPALIFRDDAGQYRLSVLENSLEEAEWVTGPRVALPGPNRIWQTDDQTGTTNLVPITAAHSLGTGSSYCDVSILQTDGEFHLVQTDIQGPRGPRQKTVTCYCKGLELIDDAEAESTLSALAPENHLLDATGWTLLDSKISQPLISGSLCVIDGGVAFSSGRDIWRQVASNHESGPTKFEVLRTIDQDKVGQISLVQDDKSRSVYVITNMFKEVIDLYRLEGGTLQRVRVSIDGVTSGAMRWIAKQVFLGFAVILVGFVGLILIANTWCNPSQYSFGHDTVILASLLRRSVARIFDLLLFTGPLIVCAVWMYIYQFHSSLFELLTNEDLTTFRQFIPFVGWAVVYWFCSTLTTGLWGVTPGKWLCQIRVIRSTLRPCGFLRALLRELLLWVDAPQLLSAIPGVTCLVGTQHCERIGDLIAGTIVIVHRSQTRLSTV